MDELLAFLKSLPDDAAREAFGVACGSSIGHLKNVAYGSKTCSAQLAAALERESGGRLLCHELLPDAGWRRVRDPSWPWHPKGRPLLDLLPHGA